MISSFVASYARAQRVRCAGTACALNFMLRVYTVRVHAPPPPPPPPLPRTTLLPQTNLSSLSPSPPTTHPVVICTQIPSPRPPWPASGTSIWALVRIATMQSVRQVEALYPAGLTVSVVVWRSKPAGNTSTGQTACVCGSFHLAQSIAHCVYGLQWLYSLRHKTHAFCGVHFIHTYLINQCRISFSIFKQTVFSIADRLVSSL